MKQTAVEFLVNEFFKDGLVIDLWQKEIEKAKEMEKQQIIKAVYYTCSSMTHYDLPCGEQYYKETFNK